MKVMMLVGEGLNQKALVNKMQATVGLEHVAIVAASNAGPSRANLVSRLLTTLFGYPLNNAWRHMMKSYHKRFPEYPKVQLSRHQGINSQTVFQEIKEVSPDLILVSGTELLKDELIKSTNCPIMNLHTGISPQIKGGPNCTNWALSLGEFENIGNTIMWIDAGIDSGAIIASEQTSLTGKESLTTLHIKVMEHAHDLYCRAVLKFCNRAKLEGVPQKEVGTGRLFLTKHWGLFQILKAVSNFYLFFPKKKNFKPPTNLVEL